MENVPHLRLAIRISKKFPICQFLIHGFWVSTSQYTSLCFIKLIIFPFDLPTGQYDTCTFYTDEGRQAFGVCCVDPPKEGEKPIVVAPIVQDDDNVILANKDSSISQWPPAFITHPPDHTAPTHPSVSGEITNIIHAKLT